MGKRFDPYIKILENRLPSALIGPHNLAGIRRVAHLLPLRLSTFFGFECRLGVEVAEADFLLHVTAAEGGAEVLAGRNPDHALPGFLQEDPCWRRIMAFARLWSTPGTELNETTDHIWLEFDVAGNPALDKPVPSFFFGLSDRVVESLRSAAPADISWVTETAFPLLWGGDLPPKQKEAVTRSFRELPAGAYVFQMGTMLSRPFQLIRICIRDIPAEAIVGYLEAVGWEGDRAGLGAEIADIAGHLDGIALDIDLPASDHGPVGSKVGLECYLDLARTDCEPRLHGFFDHLVTRGLCLEAKRRAMLAFPGYTHQWEEPGLWPEHLQQAAALFRGSRVSLLNRWIHHVKLTFEQGGVREAKGYLAVSHQWGTPIFPGAGKT